MGRIPGYVAAGGAAIGTIRVTKLNGTIAAARVILAGMIGGVSVGSAIWFRTGDDVVLVRRSANAVDLRTLFGKVGGAMDVVAELAEFYRVTVQMSHVVGHDGAVGIGPRSIADAVASVDGGMVAFSLSAQVSSPGPIARTNAAGQFLAMGIGAGEATQVGSLAEACAGYEEAQRGLRRFFCEGSGGAQNEQTGKQATFFHSFSLI